MTALPDAGAISAALAHRIEQLAVDLLGDPSSRERGEWRWRRRGSLAVVIRGERRGACFDHEIGQGGDALELVKLTLGGTLPDAIRWAVAWLGGAAPLPERRRPLADPEPADRDTTATALRLWGEAIDATGSLVERYLAGRRLALPDHHHEVIRFHRRCWFKGERVPAMVALLRDVHSDEPCGIHRTALLPDGSDRDRARGKCMLGRARNAVVKISGNDEVTLGLGLSEGIETALAVLGLGWSPLWAAASAGGIAKFPLLGGIDEITLFADQDEAGQRAAQECARRWADAGRCATIRLPREAGADWCDVRAA